jgi:YbbR domain-containing protein
MEPRTEKPLIAKVNVVGDPALGYSAEPVQARPPIIVVRGPQSLVNEVTTASGQMSIQDARRTVTQTVPLSPRDETNQTVPYVTLTPSNTVAVVQINQLGGFRDLAVKIELRGNVASGHLTTDVSVDPQVVTVFGSSSALDALPGFISTAPISITDATTDINEQVPLVLPPGISMLGDPTVRVTVKIKPIEGSVNVQIPLTPQGLQPDLSARFSPELLDVILGGPIARLGELQQSDVQAFGNLFNLISGTYQITPTVVVPSDIRIVSLLPSTVQVVIGPAISPTITATATITGPLLTPTPPK